MIIVVVPPAMADLEPEAYESALRPLPKRAGSCCCVQIGCLLI